MKKLIRIETKDGRNVVSARVLYDFLGIKRDFSTWCKRMFTYGMENGKDFTPVWVESTGGRRSIDFALTLDAAKEISMIQRTEKGKQARQYFISCEKHLQAQSIDVTAQLKAQYYDIVISRKFLNREAAKIRSRLEQLEPPRMLVSLPMQPELFRGIYPS